MPEKQRILWIDGLKGILAVIVLLSHLHWAFISVIDETMILYKFPFSFFSNGGVAVAAFICLSAMIMTLKCRDITKWQGILLKRYFRLALPICPIVLIYVLMWKFGILYNNTLSSIIDNSWLISSTPRSIKTIIKVCLTTPVGAATSYMNTHWMLKYMLYVPFVVVLLDILGQDLSWRKQSMIIVICLAVSSILDPWMCNIFVGYMFAKCFIFEGNVYVKKKWIIFILLVGLIAAYALVEYATPSMPHGASTLKGVILMLFIILCKPIKKLLSSRSLTWLGTISFELYLLHILVIYSLGCGMYLYVPYFNHRLLCIYLSVIIISIYISWGWVYVVNRPIDKWLNQLLKYFIKQ